MIARRRPLSPGIAFGCIELLGVVSRNAVTPGGVLSLSLGSVPPGDILEVTIGLGWLVLAEHELLAATPKGQRALAAPNDGARLRVLVLDYLDAENPPWLQLAPAGRRDLLLQAPSGVRQVLVEAGLAYGSDDQTVAFWDSLAAKARGIRGSRLNEIGRIGERLSMNHEKNRTGVDPQWVALDSSSDGYDILSRVSSDDRRRLTIEVKASEQSNLAGSFYVSRNEWDVAEQSLNHVFHIWDVSRPEPHLAVVTVEQVLGHMPSDVGAGVWQSTRVPFAAFSSSFLPRAAFFNSQSE